MRKSCGFTLVEILIGIALFAILSVAAFSFMQSSMTATLRQKTQQQANDNAKAILTAVTTEMKSSYREPAALTMTGKSGDPICNYKSSVIYPATAEASTADGAIASKRELVAPSIDTDEGLDRAGANKNEVVFYTRTNDGKFYVVRYAVIVENGLCRVDRFVYNWPYHTEWCGISVNSTSISLAVDGMDVRYTGTGKLGTDISEQRTTIASLPSVGDAAILYVARSWDDTYGGGLASKLSANQYFVKVLVFQTLRGLDETSYKRDVRSNFTGDPTVAATFSAGNAPLKLFKSNSSNFATNDSMKRQNYRAAELDGIVNVSY